MPVQNCKSCGRPKHVLHSGECIIYQTEDLDKELKDLCEANEEIFMAIKDESQQFLEYNNITWEDYLNHSAVLTKTLDRIGICLIRDGLRVIRKIMDPETSAFTSLDLRGYLDSMLYIFFVYNRNSAKEYHFEEEYPETPEINKWANFLLCLKSDWIDDEKYLKELKEADYDHHISSFGKVLFFKLIDQFTIYAKTKDRLVEPWSNIILKLIMFYQGSISTYS